MNYKIIGHDGKTYGPADADQIRLWITQGRVDRRTAAWPEGATDWTFLGLLPEFEAAFGGTPPPISTIRPPVPPPIKTNPFATWSLVCGVLAWSFCCCCLPLNLTGMVLGIIALSQISGANPPQEGRSLAVAGLVLSAANLLWCLGVYAFHLATYQTQWMQRFN